MLQGAPPPRDAEGETARRRGGAQPPSARSGCQGSRPDAQLAAEKPERALDPAWRAVAATLRSVSLTTLWRKHNSIFSLPLLPINV